MRRVLLVEDSEDDAALELRELNRGGHEVLSKRVETREDMSAALDEQTWDVIISDYKMPRFTGLEALRLAQEKQPDAPVIIVSGKIGEEVAVEAMKAGAQDYIMKDKLALLVPTVDRVVSQAREHIEHRKVEEALRRSEERSRRYDALFTGVVVFGTSAAIVYVNHAACEMLGVGYTDLVGQNDIAPGKHIVHEDGSPFPYEDRPGPVCLRGGEPVRDVVMGICEDSDDFRWLLLNAEPLFERFTRELKEVVVSFVDITDRKRAAEQLEAALAEVERSNAELQQFAYVASHDLQEPLRAVSSYVQLLARRYKGKLDESADEFIQFALDGVSRMQTLISDLLQYSRVSTHAKPFEDVDCEGVLAEAITNLKSAIEESGGEVTRDPLPTIVADRSQLVRLFQNLIGNGIKFRGSEPPRVHVSSESSDCEWIFMIRDNGIGIAPENHERIFQVFTRLHSREEYSGTGIGLAICKRIVERHGGDICVESIPGYGSTFKFTISKSLSASD